jgi:hypothetical protein
MLVVSDLEDMFLPIPCDLLVSLSESRPVIEKLLSSLPNMFKDTRESQNCLGRALQSAQKLIVCNHEHVFSLLSEFISYLVPNWGESDCTTELPSQLE